MCRPRNLAIVKAKSKNVCQTFQRVPFAPDDSLKTVDTKSTVAQTISPLNEGIIKNERIAESTATDAFEFFYRFDTIISEFHPFQ